MTGMSNTSTAAPDLFESPAEGERKPGRWLKGLARLQDMLLLIWLADVSFLPQNLNSLVALLWLVALWAVMVIAGAWHIVKVPDSRGLAAWGIAAFPVAFSLITVLNTTIGLPLIKSPDAHWLVIAAIAVFPLYWMARWLLRTTSPRQTSPVRMRLTTIILLAISAMLMLQSLFLVWVPFTGSDFQTFKSLFGSDWYTNLLHLTLGAAAIVSVGAVPYIILGFVRRTGHRGALLGIFFCLSISVVCTFGLFAFFAMLSYG